MTFYQWALHAGHTVPNDNHVHVFKHFPSPNILQGAGTGCQRFRSSVTSHQILHSGVPLTKGPLKYTQFPLIWDSVDFRLVCPQKLPEF